MNQTGNGLFDFLVAAKYWSTDDDIVHTWCWISGAGAGRKFINILICWQASAGKLDQPSTNGIINIINS